MEFMRLKVVAPKRKELETTVLSSVAWAEIEVRDQPRVIQIIITTAATARFIKDGAAIDASEFLLTIPVRWNGQVPQTRFRGQDNVDVAFANPDGTFLAFQASLVTRWGRFFICLQQVYYGSVLRTASSDDYSVQPLDSIHDYPGMDFQLSFPKVFEAIKVTARQIEDQPEAAVDRAHWMPPTVKPIEGRQRGVVKFFSAVTGTGFIQDLDLPDGRSLFVHFSDIRGGGRGSDAFPILLPMEGVYFNRKQQEGGQVKAINVSLAKTGVSSACS